MPAGWPDAISIDGDTYTYMPHAAMDIASSMAAASQAQRHIEWYAATAFYMDRPSQHRLAQRLSDISDPLGSTGLTVLIHRLAQNALGLDIFSAGNLCAILVSSWFPFQAWAAAQGLHVRGMPLESLLPAVYGWLSSSCSEQIDVDKLNRRLFGTKHPWGR